MNLRPLIVDRYLFREFVLSFLAVMAFCTLILLVASIFSKLGDILRYGASWDVIVKYFLYALPAELVQIVPIVTMLAVLFSVGALARTNEILAMLTSGIHGLRLSVPILAGGLLVVIGTFLTTEYVVPYTEQNRKIYEARLEAEDIRNVTMDKHVFSRGKGEWFYFARLYSLDEKKLMSPTIAHLTPDYSSVMTRIEAKSATFVEDKPEEGVSLWRFEEPQIWKFDAEGKMAGYEKPGQSVVLPLETGLPAILAQKTTPDEMNFQELSRHIDILKSRDQSVFALQTDLIRKVTFPLGILIVILIGFSYAVRSRAGTAMTLVGYGIMWAVAYYLMNAVLQALGHSGSVGPWAAALLPLMVFGIASIYYLRKSYQWHA